MGKKLWLFLACMLMTASMAFAQKQITGTVIDAENGEPLIGVTVRVPGTNTGVLTNADGKFSVALPQGKKNLSFSFMGMRPAELAARDGMVVRMETDTKAMDEVMVVAFGTSTKSAFTGSATVMDSKDLQKHTVSNVANALVGNVPGLQMRGQSGAPGASSGSMNIRGISSIYASIEPLIIVDGAPYSASLTNISQEDIESVTVLKDASSAALYGARGANGVILVTTKKGKNHGAEISVDAKWGANSRAVQDYDVFTSPAAYYEAYYSQLYNRYYNSNGMTPAAANLNANAQMLNDLQYNVYNVPAGEQLIGIDGKLNPNATLGNVMNLNGTDYYLTNDNWSDEAYRVGMRQEYNVSAKGASDKGDYYASVGMLDEDGFINYSDFQRITARFKSSYQIKKWLRLGSNVGYVNSTTNSNTSMGTELSSTNLMYYTSYVAPIYPIYVRTLDANGNPQIATDAYNHQMYDYGVNTEIYNGYGSLVRPFLSTGNPLGANRYNSTISSGNQLNGTFTADANICDFLKFNATSTVTWGHTATSLLENSFEGNKAGVNGQITKTQTSTLRTNNIQTLTYFQQFGEHDVNVMVGHEYYKTKSVYLGAAAQGLYDGEQIPEINAAANNQYSSSSYTSGYNVEGWMVNALYNYGQKYFASASYRRDASSRFAKENRWGDFWSFGAAWLVNKDFLQNQSWIDMLKVKASIGQQGNDGLSSSYYWSNLYTLKPSGTYTMSPSFAQLGNKNITWETTTNFNLGVEFGFWKNRLTGGIDFYNKYTTDQLFWLSIPESMGTRGYYGNMGDVRNTGVELSLNAVLVRMNNLEWSVAGNIAHNSNRIVHLPESKMIDPENGYRGFTESNKWLAEGKSMYTAFRPKYAGVNNQGEALYWVDDELEGKTDRPATNYSSTTVNFEEASYYDCGDMLPDVFGGFSTSLSAYGFELSASFDFQIGGKVYDTHYQSLMSPCTTAADAGSNFHKDVLKSWSTSNTNSNLPRWQYGDKYATASCDRWLTDASYLNFQSIKLSYTLPKKLTSRIGINKISVYGAGENLCFWSARKGLDPRYSFSGNTTVNVYSPSRTIMGGVQLSF